MSSLVLDPRAQAGTYATGSQVGGLAFLLLLCWKGNRGFRMVDASATAGVVMLATLKSAVLAVCTGRAEMALDNRTPPPCIWPQGP